MAEDVLTGQGSAHGIRVFVRQGKAGQSVGRGVGPGKVVPERLLAEGFVATDAPPPSSGWYLAVGDRGLALHNHATEDATEARFRPDAAPPPRRRGATAIARACGAGAGVTVLDAMAGWGSDGLTLAAAGCAVTMTESHPVVFAMLVDRVERCGSRATVELADARLRIPSGFDVVYLDPMFEPRAKTALPKKPMQVLRDIVGRDAPRWKRS